MKKKTIIKIAGIALSLVLILATVLIVHIYQATHKKTNDARLRQLSRIDFTTPIDSLEGTRIKSFVGTLPGIESVHYNYTDHILVYTYTIGSQTSDYVFKQVQQLGNFKAQKYTVSAEQLNNGCPIVGNNQSFTGKIISYLSKL